MRRNDYSTLRVVVLSLLVCLTFQLTTTFLIPILQRISERPDDQAAALQEDPLIALEDIEDNGPPGEVSVLTTPTLISSAITSPMSITPVSVIISKSVIIPTSTIVPTAVVHHIRKDPSDEQNSVIYI